MLQSGLLELSSRCQWPHLDIEAVVILNEAEQISAAERPTYASAASQCIIDRLALARLG